MLKISSRPPKLSRVLKLKIALEHSEIICNTLQGDLLEVVKCKREKVMILEITRQSVKHLFNCLMNGLLLNLTFRNKLQL